MDIEVRANELLGQMSLEEKVGQMTGDMSLWQTFAAMRDYNSFPIPAGENRRLGIPALQFTDGPRGVVLEGATCFPVAMARGATFDTALEERVGDAIGVEARALGANFFAGVCVNVLRHPAWGRAQETFGEDPYHLGEMGAALVRGVQRHVMACVKHYTANSIEGSRTYVDVRLDERALREVYLPQFKRCVDEGVAAVMSAYNRVNGEYCGHNAVLLRRILKEEWGFDGFVMSDFLLGVRDAAAAVHGGCDMEMPTRLRFRRLARAVERGRVPGALVDDAVRRILRQKLRFAEGTQPERYSASAVVCAEHRALAREVAEKSIVLLQNRTRGEGTVLPLDLSGLKRVAVLGALAAAPNTGDIGSSKARPPEVTTILAGIAAAASAVRVDHEDGKDIEAACRLVREADAAIVVAGYTHRDEGENIVYSGGDRKHLTLRAHDESLITALAAARRDVVVIMIGGGPVITESWRERVGAILMAWYPGMEGGHAVAGILFGTVNPSGRLPCVFARRAADLPFFDSKARSIQYGLLHGYRWLERYDRAAAFPFGFGLSYTSFAYSGLRIEPSSEDEPGTFAVRVNVRNTGRRAGAEVVQLYAGALAPPVERAVKELRGFRRVELAPGEQREVVLPLRARDLAYYDVTSREWVVAAGAYRILVGPSTSAGSGLSAAVEIRP